MSDKVIKPDAHTLKTRRMMAEVSDWVATYTEVALRSMEHDELMEILARHGKEMRPEPTRSRNAMYTPTDAEAVMNKYEELLEGMRERKPNNRSEEDRYWAIAITETEKAMAVFKMFVADKQPTPY